MYRISEMYFHIVIRALIFPLITMGSCYSTFAISDTGSIQLQVSGTIIDTGCDISANSTNSVELGDFQSSIFTKTGTTTPSHQLEINLTHCTSNTKGSSVYFSGTADYNSNSLLAISTTGTQAKGVGVQILDSTNNPIAINTASSVYPLKAGDNTLLFYLRYKSSMSTVTAGDANAVLYFDMTYQ